jgi:hypothetical protein
MMLIAWTTLIADPEKGFPKEEGQAYLPGSSVREAIGNAWVFYWVKKDKSLQNKARKHLENLQNDEAFLQASEAVRSMVFALHPLEDLVIPEKIPLPAEGLRRRHIEVFDLEEQKVSREFEALSFRGTIPDVQINTPQWEKIRTALTSYARALAEYEHKHLVGTYLEESCAAIQNSIANEWESALRLGAWSNAPHGGGLFFFWRFPELRRELIRKHKQDLLPTELYIVSGDRELLGWCEYCKEG